jgi:hypothetical protein
MIINYRYKYTEIKLFFLKYLLKIMHIFHQEIYITSARKSVSLLPPTSPEGGLIRINEKIFISKRVFLPLADPDSYREMVKNRGIIDYM